MIEIGMVVGVALGNGVDVEVGTGVSVGGMGEGVNVGKTGIGVGAGAHPFTKIVSNQNVRRADPIDFFMILIPLI